MAFLKTLSLNSKPASQMENHDFDKKNFMEASIEIETIKTEINRRFDNR
jgi:hypothetical protein